MTKLIVLDVDGSMTDGSITFDEKGIESKSFNVKDGLGITTWIKIGGEAAIITGRSSKIVERRAKELGIVHFFQGIKNKKEILQSLINTLAITPAEVAVIGDDLNDIGMFRIAAQSFAPKDATEEAKKYASTILTKEGGKGAVREMIDILVEQNGWKDNFEQVWL